MVDTSSSQPILLSPGEVIRTSGKFSKPTKIPGKNYSKDEVVIKNSDSGKGKLFTLSVFFLLVLFNYFYLLNFSFSFFLFLNCKTSKSKISVLQVKKEQKREENHTFVCF